METPLILSTLNDEFPARMTVEIMFCCLLVLVITANIWVFIRSKVYKNFNSSSILVCLTLLQILRLITYMQRLITGHNVNEDRKWNRMTTDLCNYLIALVSIILFAQWHQTYSVLVNPLRAIRTLESNWAFII